MGAFVKQPLKNYQRSFALNHMAFGIGLLSPDVSESLRRASLACAENGKKQTGIMEFVCGLYLHDKDEVTLHFRGDLDALVHQYFRAHRFGREGLVPQAMLDGAASEDASSVSSFGFSLNYSDDLLRLLWLSAKLANAVGRKASIKDVVAALSLDPDWVGELERAGIAPSRVVADFDRDVRAIVFHANVHTGEGWPTELSFEPDASVQSPFTLDVCTPSGPFQPVRSATVRLNDSEPVGISWPEKPAASFTVDLVTQNKVVFEVDGPRFGSIEVTVKGTPA
jgi:hypothetical protein